jgi:chemotaxis protein histidine kinase CheA
MDVLDGQLRDADTAGVAVAEPDRPRLTQLMQNFCTLQRCYSALLPQSRSYLLLLLEDLLGKTLKGEMELSLEFYELVRSALIIVQQEYNRVYDPQPEEADEQDLLLRHDLLLERIRSLASLSDAMHEREKIATAISGLSHGMTISPALKALLTHENIIELMEQFQQGRQLYEISVDLESSEDVAIQFMGWVEDRGTMITSHYEFHGDKSICMILLLSNASFEQVSKELHAIDDQVVVRSCQSGVTLVPVSPLSATPVAPATFQVPVASDHVEIKVSGGQPDPGASPASMIRVAGATLDLLMNRVGELVLLHAQLSHTLSDPPAQAARIRLKRLLANVEPVNRTGAGKEGGSASNANHASNANINEVMEILQEQQSKLEEVEERIHASLSRLQEGALELRVVPIETVLRRLPRMVRDISLSQNKKIRLDMQGQEVRIDKAMVEVLTDPLMHMVRNSADHGIDLPAKRVANGKPEEGCISIKAFQQGPRVVIRVSDDGLGIDHRAVLQKAIERGLVAPHQGEQLSREAIYDFLFMPGFSTAKVVTEISGRGVGLDVVRNNVMRLGGTIQVQSELGRGTTFTLEMPLSAAVQDAMLVAVGGQTLALPARFVIEVLEVDHHDIQTIKGREAVLLRGAFLPLVHMADLLGFSLEPRTLLRTSYAVVVLSNGQQMVGVVVDRMVGRRDLFIKDIPARLAELPGVGGASILGDGKVVLILDGEALLRLAQSMRTSSILSQGSQQVDLTAAVEPDVTALLSGVA